MIIDDNEFRQSVMLMRNKDENLNRAGEYWSDEERNRLQMLFDSGTGITAIALLLQRTELAVIMQANQMDLFTPPSKKRKYAPRQPRCLCRNCKMELCPVKQMLLTGQEVPQCCTNTPMC